MKRAGYILITISFLAGSLTTVLDQESVPWLYFAAILLVGFVGVAMVRIAERQKGSIGKLTANMQSIEQSLRRIFDNVTLINSQAETTDPYQLRHRIDELVAEDMETFVETRKSIAQMYGLQAYANTMNHFAAGQRYLNRVWSASADGYANEATTYLGKAKEQFKDALESVRQLGTDAPTS